MTTHRDGWPIDPAVYRTVLSQRDDYARRIARAEAVIGEMNARMDKYRALADGHAVYKTDVRAWLADVVASLEGKP